MARDLPLSQRPRRDESSVTANWAAHRGAILLETAGMLDELPAHDWGLPALRPDSTVRSVVAELVWLARGTARQRAVAVARRALADRTGFAAASRALVLEQSNAEPAELVRAVRGLAVDDLSGRGSRTVASLSPAVVAAFDLSAVTGRDIAVDPLASGAVAVARSLSAPVEIRAVVTARTLVATDAAWRVGRGPELPGTAAGIVLFLFGRGAPPKPGETAG